jgi:phosphoenolpyruvate carboxykinase (ATP)
MVSDVLVQDQLARVGINAAHVFYKSARSQLVREILRRNEGDLSNSGAVVVETGKNTGRAPKDKYVVQSPSAQNIWWGEANHPLSEDDYLAIRDQVIAHLSGRDLFIEDLRAGADSAHSIGVRVITPLAWHALFSRNLFLPQGGSPVFNYTIYDAPDCTIDPTRHHTNSDIFVIINFDAHEILIGGTRYAGEIKKSIFTVMNFHMPAAGVLPMHCSANTGNQNDVSLFFGLSGTGKTTLSSDTDRRLIGDDEHGWSDKGVFNFEGGCYAKTIRLNQDLEPLIWNAVERFGSVLENTRFQLGTYDINYDDVSLTENTRGAYPMAYISNRVAPGFAGHPENIFFLSADAFGILPPISRLTPEQAMYYFLSGYTAKLAGTEKDLKKEPQPTFSVCFAAPFLPLKPVVYASMLMKKIQQMKVNVWLVNTGWTGGAFGTGSRIPIPYTRMLVKSALNGDLAQAPMTEDSIFNLAIPLACPGIPEKMLDPKLSWQNQDLFQKTSQNLLDAFRNNIKQYAADLPAEVIAAGPH